MCSKEIQTKLESNFWGKSGLQKKSLTEIWKKFEWNLWNIGSIFESKFRKGLWQAQT